MNRLAGIAFGIAGALFLAFLFRVEIALGLASFAMDRSLEVGPTRAVGQAVIQRLTCETNSSNR